MYEFSKLLAVFYSVIAFIALATEMILKPIAFLPDSRLLLIGLIIILIFLRIVKMRFISKKIHRINHFLLLVLTVFAFSFLVLENIYGFHFVAEQFSISYSRVFYLTMMSAFLALYSVSFWLSKKIGRLIILFTPVYLGLISFFFYIRNNPLFRILVKDDHVVEYLQFFLLFGCTFFCIKLSKYWWNKERILGIIFLLSALLCFFVAGEEISWGQRIFNISTPEILAERNLQDELTIHNIDVVFGYVYRGYILIGLYGSTAWIFFRMIKNKISKKWQRIISNLTPQWYLILYFALAFVYNFDRFYIRLRTGEALWEEPMELLLILGITIFFVTKYVRTAKPEFLNKLFSK